jgi:low temperature requirement protein LtrA
VEFLGFLWVLIWPQIRLPFHTELVEERFALFTLIILGELIISMLFEVDCGTTNAYFALAFVGLLIISFQARTALAAAALVADDGGRQVFYFDIESAPQKQHALMRAPLVRALWYLSHLPLQAALVARCAPACRRAGFRTALTAAMRLAPPAWQRC